MRRHLLLLIFLLSLPFFFVIRFSAAPLLLQVNERATRFYPKQGRAEVALAVRNLAPHVTRARIKLELLDPEDCVRAELQKDENLAIGAQSVVLSLPFDIDDVPQDERLELTWYRLRYRITPAADEPEPGRRHRLAVRDYAGHL